jgi:hypothetical protein
VNNLSKHVFTDSEEAVVKKGLNFSVTYPHSNLGMASAVESCCFEASADSGYGIQIKDQVHVREV